MALSHQLHESLVIILVELDVASRIVHHFNLAQLMHMAIDSIDRGPSWIDTGFATRRSVGRAG